ncbi:hypothetical protein DL766_003326 [Monosporascus sp. MC13-8B]|uniref:BZIP domain-containing protein n=1 Tax=Monosporascus cannonballus TaxID=155416 RepID=A0ABY0H6M1_9PEZI|nr:hypothetical protein DL762_004829 [Monosporascus cannonballus]RYO93180.1 hypothetical protein DL763_004452 [Monosporascus cannonballus]RYP33697.1 hypothetical protein DL766_003326 [Monosporascus sp. MC13-8B]
MYGSYGSYSSMSSVAQPMDIGSGSYLSRSTSLSYHQSSCAYPSWPQRASLMSSSPEEERASSYLSDDDLLICDAATEEDGQTLSGASSNASASPFITEQEMLEMQHQQMALQREAIRMLVVNERDRRRQAFKKSRARTSYSKKSPKPKKGDMAPITEAGAE